MDPQSFLQGQSRETTIRRDALGRWFHDGAPLDHAGLTRAFDRWLERAEDGRYCLKNDINWAYVTIEGPPLFVRTVRLEPSGDVKLSLSDDRVEPLAADTLRQDRDGALYADVRDRTMVARFDRLAMQQLESVLKEDEQGVYLALGAERVRPKVVSDPLQPLGMT
ncbi:MAG TPA: hypothetical protein VGI70_15205 [Polyangiales bacterium]|jgi:hypothetical protein